MVWSIYDNMLMTGSLKTGLTTGVLSKPVNGPFSKGHFVKTGVTTGCACFSPCVYYYTDVLITGLIDRIASKWKSYDCKIAFRSSYLCIEMASQNVNVNNLNMSGTNQSGFMGPMDPINVMKQLSVLKVCTSLGYLSFERKN